ncbi:MAG: 3-deoxy-D-manno-octulosonic acid transferase [Candidatus Binatia bacterium]|nr:3-deoxy-D-manno-octulosonic acid transferase [Candidatus Binatia bacterium]
MPVCDSASQPPPTPFAVYNVFLSLLILPLLPVAGLALLLTPRYRCGLGQRLGFLPAALRDQLMHRRPVWLHGPSVGEIVATRPFLQALKQALPHIPILLSVQTPTAYAIAPTRLPEADAVIYFPLDHPFVLSRVLRQVAPLAFFFTETEIWPNMLSTLTRRGIPTFLVSGRFSPRALTRSRRLAWVFRPILQNHTLCCMQTTQDAERLIAAGAFPERVIVTGSFKVDATPPGDHQGQAILHAAGLGQRPLLIAASTHAGEEEVLLHAYDMLRTAVPRLVLLLAPRHPQRFPHVEQLLKTKGYRYLKRSQVGTAQGEEVEVFLLDTLGELVSFYSSATLAFVGGSLVKGPGGHSLIEPALAQVPVCFGPHTQNFAAIAEALVHAGGGCAVPDAQSLCHWALPLLTDSRARREAGWRAYEVVKQGQGAVARTMAAVLQHLQRGVCPHPEPLGSPCSRERRGQN